MKIYNADEKVPELPPISGFSKIPAFLESNKTVSGLPSIPQNSFNDNINQEMVKSAINDFPEENEVNGFGGCLEGFRNSSEDSSSDFMAKKNQCREEKDTIFIKIEKFQNAQIILSEIQKKIMEISKAIQELKITKIKEVQEVNYWDEEMRKINQKLIRIDSNIFGEK